MTNHELEPQQTSVEVGDKEGTYEQKKAPSDNGGQTVYLGNSQKTTPITLAKPQPDPDKKKKEKKVEAENIFTAS